ncbi:aminopeptidase N [Desulfogranum japonicum]|uniref:aminopeptidase N n=1 Tax=Desulfogranum japonicum TaxID=231447 RepID=UPI0004033585|nr:aminopeptidase N [Desulfogranum japonicum]
MTSTKKEIFLKDYSPPAYCIDTVDLTFELDQQATVVTSRLMVRKNNLVSESLPLELDGEKLQLKSVKINDTVLAPGQYIQTDETLCLENVPDSPFALEIVTVINPENNTALEGLYLSSGNYCTQCEAEGFRRITYYPDRPDVMAVFTTRIIADPEQCPVLLSNGNLIEEGMLADGRKFTLWQDPFKKPSYLFALVAGKLVCIQDTFTTMTGRTVDLHIYVEERNKEKCGHAMTSLKKSMRWDEEVFGREYDLDLFMIVAVDDFNMGAMENKGLNVFNSKYVLALPETATDADFAGIEGVIGHEYFHNWTGNRITCRDWFQLSLKEGLTVFRDQQFSADMTSHAVKRIQDANIIRSFQFREDSGPMAHPVRPPSFVEINNFYTLTVYNKGAEVIRMIYTLLGAEQFRKGMDLYFQRHDGQAVTCDDFVQSMEDACGVDLRKFRRWYSQAGTPELQVSTSFDPDKQEYTVHVKQSCPPTREMDQKDPFYMPLAMGILDRHGEVLFPSTLDGILADKKSGTVVHIMQDAEQSFVFNGVKEEPVLSFLRNFSAPVKVKIERSSEELGLLMAHDPDSFNRWDASQQLMANAILEQLEIESDQASVQAPPVLLKGIETLLEDRESDPALIANALILPSENWLGQQLQAIDPVKLFRVRHQLRHSISERLRDLFLARYQELASDKAYIYSPEETGRRALRNCCLGYLLVADLKEGVAEKQLQLGEQQYRTADNMTDRMAALNGVVHGDLDLGDRLLKEFHATWGHDPLLIDKWLMLQASNPLPGTLERVKSLTEHPDFSLKNPNKVRSLIGAFCSTNHAQFHAANGAGYTFLVDTIFILDDMNPQIAARMLTPLTQWRRYESKRKNLMEQQLVRLKNHGGLSSDVREIVERSLE